MQTAALTEALAEKGFQPGAAREGIACLWLRVSIFASLPSVTQQPTALILGPTGSRKTFLSEKMCQHLRLPKLSIDLCQRVPSRIAGPQVAEDMTRFFIDFEHEYRHPWGTPSVVVFDEVHTLTQGVNGPGQKILREPLSLLSGAGVPPNGDRNSKEYANSKEVTLPPLIPTSHLVVLALRSFDGVLTRIGKRPCGFAAQSNPHNLWNSSFEDIYRRIEEQADIPGELLGRLTLPPVVLEALTREDFLHTLHSPGPFNRLESLVRDFIPSRECRVTAGNETLERIADETKDRGVGLLVTPTSAGGASGGSTTQHPRTGHDGRGHIVRCCPEPLGRLY